MFFCKFAIQNGYAQITFDGGGKQEPHNTAPTSLGKEIVNMVMQLRGKLYFWDENLKIVTLIDIILVLVEAWIVNSEGKGK